MGTPTVRAALAWLVMSLAWVAVVLTWCRLGHDPAPWTAVCVGLGSVLVALLVLAVPFATQAVQVHLRYAPRLALSAFDWVFTTYAVGFLVSALLPLLMAAAPSRATTLASVALFGPVALTLLPAWPFFSQRLRPTWLLRRYTHGTIRMLERPPDRRRTKGWRAERHLLDESATAVYGLLDQGEDLTLEDRDEVNSQAVRLLGAALDRNQPWSTSFVIGYLQKDLVPLAQRHSRASLTRDVRHILCGVAGRVHQETGAAVISAVLRGLVELGAEATHRERKELADSIVDVAVAATALSSRAVAPDSLDRLPSRPTPSRETQLPGYRASDFRQRLSTYTVLDTAVTAVEWLTGPPVRSLDDGQLARESAALPVHGCQLLSQLTTRLLREKRWVEYELILAPLAAWAHYGLGTGPDRSADLTEREPQRVPYAQELEATATALVTVAESAFEASFDHVAREALEGLVTGAAEAAKSDPTAFVLYARALDKARMVISRRSQPDLARNARLADLLEALQPANRQLLVQVKKAKHTGEMSPVLSAAIAQVHRWALRPTAEDIAGHEAQALAIARTAARVLEVDREDSGSPSAPDAAFLEKVYFTLSAGAAYDDSSGPEFALLSTVLPTFPRRTAHPVAVHGAVWLWDLLMREATAGRWEEYPSLPIRSEVERSSSFRSGAGLSADADTFIKRFRSWADSPWCLSRSTRLPVDVPDERSLITYGKRTLPEEGAAHLVGLLRQRQDAREQHIQRKGWTQHSRDAMRDRGILWGDRPPPPGSPDDPVGGYWHGLKAEKLPGRSAYSGFPRRRRDRVYQARMAGLERVVITEPDGTNRPLRGVSSDLHRTPLHYGGTGISILGDALVRDVLGPWQYCPSCHGASAQMLLPGYCHTCSGSGNHPGLGAAQQAVERSLPGSGHEWDITRSEFLDAIVTMTDDS
ncbi:hypothetical protein N0X72_05725 [Streptomyces carpaticus]|uniref:hypothetical protein n=1 Tax=Streptomyces carpaticus TaxID=285558 RepID=UPI00220DA077|nr:hypothetical protein N0X72_05725 [Streptomyces carpaticus]